MVYRTLVVSPIETHEQRDLLTYGMSFLPERERTVLEEIYFGHNMLEDIGQSLGVTRQRVEQIRDNAIGRLRRVLQRRQFYDVSCC